MSRKCELTGKGPITGHNVSHAQNKTKRRFLPNLCTVTLLSDTLKKSVRLKVSASALRSVDHVGGLDAFLVKNRAEDMSPRVAKLKREVEKAKTEAAA